MRQVFNDTDADVLWLVVGAPPELANTLEMTAEQLAHMYPDGRAGEALPREWEGAFDLVVEIITVQSLPEELRGPATAAIAGTVAPGGTLFVISAIRDGAPGPGPPWPLTREQVEAFAAGDLELRRLDRLPIPGLPGEHRWLAVLERPA